MGHGLPSSSPLRRLLLSLLALLAVGCSTVRHLPPPGLVKARDLTVFTDGFHSGMVLERGILPAGFDPRTDDTPATWPQQTLHFGEERWTAGEDNSLLHAVGLVFIPGAGVVQSDHTRPGLQDVPGLHLDHLRTWTFAVDQAGVDRLLRDLRHAWLTGEILERPPDEASNLYRSPHSWSVFHNCHDFTVALLRSAGLDLRGRPIYLAGGLARDLDDASAELAAAGIHVIGPAPVPPTSGR